MDDLATRALRKRIHLRGYDERGNDPDLGLPAPCAHKDGRTTEQRAIDTLLTSFQDVVRSSGAGPLFGRPARGRK